MTDFADLASKPESEIKKMTKAELSAAVLKNRHTFDYYKNKVADLQKSVAQNAENERAACVVLAAFVGVELSRNEYSGQLDTTKLNILELVGLVTAKCVSVRL
jgi:hypothetical protein